MNGPGDPGGNGGFFQRVLGRHDIFDAIEKGDNQLCWKLLSSNHALLQRTDKNGRMPLHAAACKGSLEIVKMILFKGVDPNGSDANGSTPLHWAGVGGSIDVIEELVSAGADVLARDAAGYTPSEVARMRGCEEAAELLQNYEEKKKKSGF